MSGLGGTSPWLRAKYVGGSGTTGQEQELAPSWQHEEFGAG